MQRRIKTLLDTLVGLTGGAATLAAAANAGRVFFYVSDFPQGMAPNGKPVFLYYACDAAYTPGGAADVRRGVPFRPWGMTRGAYMMAFAAWPALAVDPRPGEHRLAERLEAARRERDAFPAGARLMSGNSEEHYAWKT